MKINRLGWMGSVAAALVLMATLQSAEAATKVRLAGNFSVDHSSSLAMARFAKDVAERTGGDLVVDVFPAMQLGGAKENVDQVRSGAILMTWIGMAYLSRTVPELEAVSLPFVFPDREAAFHVIDGKVGKLLDDKLAKKGFLSLGYMELGSRNVTNNVRPIRTIDDFKGLKIRLQPNQTHLATFRAIGANPVSMGIKEVYSALQQGVLDGEENPYSIILTKKFNEVQKYLSDSGHFFDFIIVIANKKRFAALKPAHRAALRGAMGDAIAWQRAKAAAEDGAARKALIASGMQFDPLSSALRSELRKRTAGVVDALRKRIGSDIIEAVLADAKK